MSDTEYLLFMCYAVGLASGLAIGWFMWRMPMIHAEQRGQEAFEDGLCIQGGRYVNCRKKPDAASINGDEAKGM